MTKAVTRKRFKVPDISFTAQVWKEGKAYVAYAPELDVSSCGDTTSEAKSRLREAVTLLLEESSRKGVLEAILSEAGFERSGNTYRPHAILARERLKLAVPVAS